jgi:UDP-N-acetylglucosamine/UDP-N-acetyl-alpha-D-glucosaminouronate 4-epimerase
VGTLGRVRVLVTGGGGFIGSHLAERLLERGDEVRVLDSFATGRRENLVHLPDVEIVEGDVQSFERAHHAVRGCEVVLHEAALPSVPRSIQDPLTTNAVNVTGTLNVLLAARDAGVRRVVYASSSSVYGSYDQLPKREDQPVAPISPYAVSKLAGEGFCRAFTTIYGLECVSLRYFNVFGPRQDPLSQYAAVIPRFIAAALDGKRPVVFGDGEQSRDFTYIDNVVEANLLALESSAGAGEVFNAACGERVSLNTVLSMIAELSGTELDPEYQEARRGEVRHSQADIQRARETFGYQASIPFFEGLRRTFEHAVAMRRESAVAAP